MKVLFVSIYTMKDKYISRVVKLILHCEWHCLYYCVIQYKHTITYTCMPVFIQRTDNYRIDLELTPSRINQ